MRSKNYIYTLNSSSCIEAKSERSRQKSDLKYDGYTAP